MEKLFASEVNTVDACAKLCEKNEECVAFDVITSGAKGVPDACRGVRPAKDGGKIKCDTDTDLREFCVMPDRGGGKDDKKDNRKPGCEGGQHDKEAMEKLFASEVNTVDACAKLCEKNEECVAFDVITSGAKGV